MQKFTSINIVNIYKTILTFLLHAILVSIGLSQVSPDSTNFIPPVRHKMKLAGSFAELRTNHFHSGIDIKSTSGKVGDPIVAIEEGYLSRIKIESSGYGRALYFDHPNGYTSVYAHLDSFAPKIESYLKKIQNKLQQSHIDVYLDTMIFNVNQGDQIGTMGNSGRSTAPHLHFEIRESKSEKPVMPSRFDIAVKDNIAPTITGFYIYELTEDGEIIKKHQLSLSKENNSYISRPKSINIKSKYAGVGLVCYDTSNGVHNKNGVHKLEVKNDSSLIFQAKFDKIDFSESKAINAIIDYPHYEKYRSKIIKLFSSKCNPLSNYIDNENYGIIECDSVTENKITVLVSDVYNNISNVKVELVSNGIVQEIKNNGKVIACGINDTLRLESGNEIVFYENSLYANTNIEVTETFSPYKISIESNGPPTHGHYALNIYNEVPFTSLAKRRSSGSLVNFGGTKTKRGFSISLDEFGEYVGINDTIPPIIKRVATIPKSGYKIYYFKVTDNFNHDSSLGDLNIKVEGCDEWVLHTFDKKSDQIIIDSRDVKNGCKNLVLKVADHNDNATTLSTKL